MYGAIFVFILFTMYHHTESTTSIPACIQNCNLWCYLCESGRITSCERYTVLCHQIKCEVACAKKYINMTPGTSSHRFCNELCDTDHIMCEAASNRIKESLHCLSQKTDCHRRCNKLVVQRGL